MGNDSIRRRGWWMILIPALLAFAPTRAEVGIWTTAEELAALPTSGPAWANVLSEANEPTGTPNLADQEDEVNVRVMAKALVYARTKQASYRDDVIGAIRVVTYGNTEAGGRTLALCRELGAYVVAADLVGLPSDLDPDFRAFLVKARTEVLDGSTMISTHEDRPNNWGTHCSHTRAAIARYLNDSKELARVAQVFRGWLGDRSSYSGFTYGALDWQSDPNHPIGVNPVGATKEGHDIDGVEPDDQRRAGAWAWPPPKTVYEWGALQGSVATAVILYRGGYPDVWNWQNQALRRAVDWLHRTAFSDGANYPAEGDDTWLPHLINYYYGTNYPAPVPSRPGKNYGWTDWTHAAHPATGTTPAKVSNLVRRDRAP